jgi:hypothetical protein
LTWALLGLAGIGIVVLLVVLAKILSWVSVVLAPWLGYVTYLCWAMVIIILTPLAFFRLTKAFARFGLLVAASLFGGLLWLGSIDLLYGAWGVFAVFIGLCLGGIGVVPLAFLAALLTFDWGSIFGLLVLFASAAGTVFAARRMERKPAAAPSASTTIANQPELG